MRTLGAVIVTAVLVSAFWIFFYNIRTAPQVDGEVAVSGDKTTVGSQSGTVTVAEGVTVGPSGLAIPVAGVKAAVSIPVIVNGDILDAASARAALARSGADGVMVGRGARGRPWVIGEIAAALAGRAVPARPTLGALVCGHYAETIAFYGRDLGVRMARKHLGWYLDGVAGSGPLRARLMALTDPDAVLDALARGLGDLPEAMAA